MSKDKPTTEVSGKPAAPRDTRTNKQSRKQETKEEVGDSQAEHTGHQPQRYSELPQHVRANIADMQKRSAKIEAIIEEALAGTDGDITDEQLKEIIKRIASIKKVFTEYDW